MPKQPEKLGLFQEFHQYNRPKLKTQHGKKIWQDLDTHHETLREEISKVGFEPELAKPVEKKDLHVSR